MALQELTSRAKVLEAIAELEVSGREAFLDKYRVSRGRSFVLKFSDRLYDAAAIACVAYGRQFPDRGPLSMSEVEGGEAALCTRLTELGFTVQDVAAFVGFNVLPPQLTPGSVYSWDELGAVFQFKPNYLSAAGGMVPSKMGSLLLITHPGGAKSFNYEDYWDGNDLIYTGRGKTGDQKLEGQNLSVEQNSRLLFVFEPGMAPRKLLYLGGVTCQQSWWAHGEDDNGESRRIIRFRLRFKGTGPHRRPQDDTGEDQSRRIADAAVAKPERHTSRQPAHRRPRPFDESRSPAVFIPSGERTSPEETLALQEKALQGHHALLAALKKHLVDAGWSGIEEIPSAVDLWARAPSNGVRVIFEAKTLDVSTELQQTRAALAQLLEYRFFYGTPDDELCLVTSAPIGDARERFLAAIGISVLARDGEGFRPSGALSRPWIAELLSTR